MVFADARPSFQKTTIPNLDVSQLIIVAKMLEIMVCGCEIHQSKALLLQTRHQLHNSFSEFSLISTAQETFSSAMNFRE